MFPAESDKPLFDDPSIFFEQDKIQDAVFAESAASEGKELINDEGAEKRPRKMSSGNQIRQDTKGISSDSKKTAHREIERQRRQEMAGLYASLRSLLPLEYVKGKRAISDHMHQAVKYINAMQQKIEEMKIRRDNLKKLCNVSEHPNSINIGYSPYNVKVNLLRDSMEILISSSLDKGSIPLSAVLADLVGRGLHVTTCVSTRGNRCFLHKLHLELNGTTSIDLSALQDRLINLVKNIG